LVALQQTEPEWSTSSAHLRRNMSYPGVQLTSHKKILADFARSPPRFRTEKKKNVWQRIVTFMDFDLLKDPVYLNLVFGLSIFYVAEQNFKMVTPFFFASIGYVKGDIALFLSVQAFTDILARLILPPICDRINVSKRTLFMTGIFVLGICRSGKYRQRFDDRFEDGRIRPKKNQNHFQSSSPLLVNFKMSDLEETNTNSCTIFSRDRPPSRPKTTTTINSLHEFRVRYRSSPVFELFFLSESFRLNFSKEQFRFIFL
jgi:hypothetical protein